MKNFTNGSLVLRVWRFDGESELIAKFAYYDHAKSFAESMFNQDTERKADLSSYFYLAVCEYECEAKAFGTKAEGRTS
jgi:hypothetical protein